MKKIICYGDSNTFGFNPKNGSRYDEKTRWTSLLQKNLGEEYEIVNEGMCDRTGFVNNPNGFLFSGPKHFPYFIKETNNTYALILWIGTNDLMLQYNTDFDTIERGLKNFIKLAQTKTNKTILIPPVILSEQIMKGFFRDRFDEKGIIKSKEIGIVYKKVADEYNCEFLDINEFIKPSDIDGLHFDKNSHKIIADKLTCLF